MILAICALCGGLFLLFSGDETASDLQAELDFIVEQHLLASDYDAIGTELQQETADNIQAAIEGLGGEMIDRARFEEALFGDFHAAYRRDLRDTSRATFAELFTPEEIAGLAEFYRSDEGHAFLMGLQSSAPEHTDRFVEGPGAPLAAHYPEIVSRMQRPVMDASGGIRDMFSGNRLADILETDGIVQFKDASMRADVTAQLRQMP